MNPGATKELTGSPLKVSCNDKNGYDLYAIGFSGDSYDTNNTDMLSSLGTSYNIKTNTSGSNSYWAMKVVGSGTNTPTIDNSYSNYKTIPTTYTKISHFTGTTTNSITTPTYKVTLSSDQAAGTYTGKVKYTIVHPSGSDAPAMPQPSTAGCINYFANASDAVGTMGCQSATDGASLELLASNFSRTGYGFAGWSDSFDYATNPNAKFYGPQETITVPEGTTANGLSLYAVWVKSEGNLQDADKVTPLCGTNGTGGSLTTAPTDGTANLKSVSALTDQRDNNTYAIAKLADGKCWMIENLRLDNTATLTLANTNSPLSDGANVTLKHNYTDTTTSNTLSPTSSVAYNANTAPDGWCTTNSAACDDQSRLRTDNTANRASNPTTNGVAMYSYGNYYNWYSATAGRGTYSFSTNNNSVAGDLCPAGWHLPKGGSSANATNSDFWQLGLGIMGAAPSDNSQYTSSETNSAGKTATAAFRSYPNNFVYAGYVFGGYVVDRASSGYFWSSTAVSSSNARGLHLGSTRVSPGSSSSVKYHGRAVRCVAPGV